MLRSIPACCHHISTRQIKSVASWVSVKWIITRWRVKQILHDFFKIRCFQSPTFIFKWCSYSWSHLSQSSWIYIWLFSHLTETHWHCLNYGKQRLSQLYYCRLFFGSQGNIIFIPYKSWICPVLEYGSVLYSGVALTHLNCLDSFQVHVQYMCGFTFLSLTNHHNVQF